MADTLTKEIESAVPVRLKDIAKPYRKYARRAKLKPHSKAKSGAKPAKKRVMGKGKYERVCAEATCRKPFRTPYKSKTYCSKRCGNRSRGKRWYATAQKAIKTLARQAKQAGKNLHAAVAG